MYITNYHTHSHYDDGTKQIEEYVIQAINKGMYALGFSGHCPVPFASVWNMKYEDMKNYVKDVRTVQKKYEGQLKIYLGLEADYIEGLQHPQTFDNFGLDYVIGSVHYLKQLPDGSYWNFDTSPKEYKRGVDEAFNGNIKEAVKAYYNSVIELVTNHSLDVFAHFDVINKFNQYKQKNVYFDEEEQWYRNLATEALEAVKQSNCILEINTRGYYKKLSSFFYPNNWIIDKCKQMNIPLTFSADAHAPDQVDAFFAEVLQVLKEKGIKELFYFDEKGWQPQGIK